MQRLQCVSACIKLSRQKVLDGFLRFAPPLYSYETYPALGKSFREILHNYAMHVGVIITKAWS